MVEVSAKVSRRHGDKKELEDQIKELEDHLLRLLDALVEMDDRICSLERSREMSLDDLLR